MPGKSKSAYIGTIEFHNRSWVSGWAVNTAAPNEAVCLQVVEDNCIIAELSPALFRWDLQQQDYGYHGFRYPLSPLYSDGRSHELQFRFAETGQPLSNSPVRICSLEERRFVPFETTELTGHTVLVLAPHPDDESFGCGGSIILHCNQGDPVKVVFLTDGAQGDISRQHEREQYIAVREAEAWEACRLLGTEDVEFWRIPDRTCTPTPETVERLSALLQRYRPSLIYTCSPLEFHPDHQAVAQIVWRAVQQTQLSTQVALYEVNTPFRINTLIDISPVLEQKKRACNAYVSQLKNCPYTDFAESLNRYRALTVAASCTHAEGYLVCDTARITYQTLEMFLLEHIFPTRMTADVEPALVSIIVRTKNRLPLLKQALSSIATQTYPNIEVVVVNDGGQDVSPVLAEFLSFLDIQSTTHEQSRGRAAAANAGLRLARGKYINFLDDDDVLYPHHIEKLAEYLTTTGEQFVYSDCEQGHYRWSDQDFVLNREKEPFQGVDFDPEQLHADNYIPIMTAMFRRDFQERVGPFDESLDIFEDWDLWIRMAKHTCFHRLPGISAEYRVLGDHGYNYTHWKARIYTKHEHDSSAADVTRWTQHRVDALQQENLHLRRLLAHNQEQIALAQNLPRYVQNPLLWRMNQFVRKRLPSLLKTGLCSWKA